MGILRNIFSVTGFCDSTQDLERRPKALAHILERSLAKADQQSPFSAHTSYEMRLRTALDGVVTADLATLSDKRILVCLDHRLTQAHIGGSPIRGIYYNSRPKLLTLFDDGKMPGEKGIFAKDINHIANGVIGRLAKTIRADRDMPNLMIASDHSRFNPIVGLPQFYFDWNNEKTVKAVLQKHPELRIPPVINSGRASKGNDFTHP